MTKAELSDSVTMEKLILDSTSGLISTLEEPRDLLVGPSDDLEVQKSCLRCNHSSKVEALARRLEVTFSFFYPKLYITLPS